ncbi:MAG: hypothetical protein ABS79_04225 [Planctomycetes bacterium SCN 63-9]|nr:MAG: hypothetical protein ABS79_04225 [Planctomycetes bacterium SCN 63-9]
MISLLRAAGTAFAAVLLLAIVGFESGCEPGATPPGQMIKDPPPAPPGTPSSDDVDGSSRKGKGKSARVRREH